MKANFIKTALLATTVILVPEMASAYVGPGAGLSLLGALWALVAAVGVAIFFVVAWPVRRLLRNRSRNRDIGPEMISDGGVEPLSKENERD